MNTLPGEWVTRANTLRLAEELGELRIAATHATGLPLSSSTRELADALNTLPEPPEEPQP